MNKKLLIILGISLAANFILIGFETAKIIYQPAFPDIPPERPRFVRPEGQIPGGLDFQDQKLMREAFKAAVKNHDKEMESARQEVEDALKSEPFDTEKFKSAMQKATDVRSTIDAAVQENMVGLLSKMTPEERRSFADRFSRKGQPGFHGKKRPDRFSSKHRGPNARPNKGGIPFAAPCPGPKPCPATIPCPGPRMEGPVPCRGPVHHRRPCDPVFKKGPVPCPCFNDGAAESARNVRAREKTKQDAPKKQREMKRLQPAKAQPAQ